MRVPNICFGFLLQAIMKNLPITVAFGGDADARFIWPKKFKGPTTVNFAVLYIHGLTVYKKMMLLQSRPPHPTSGILQIADPI